MEKFNYYGAVISPVWYVQVRGGGCGWSPPPLEFSLSGGKYRVTRGGIKLMFMHVSRAEGEGVIFLSAVIISVRCVNDVRREAPQGRLVGEALVYSCESKDLLMYMEVANNRR